MTKLNEVIFAFRSYMAERNIQTDDLTLIFNFRKAEPAADFDYHLKMELALCGPPSLVPFTNLNLQGQSILIESPLHAHPDRYVRRDDIIHPGPRTPATPREPEPSEFVERLAKAVADAMFTYRGGRTSMPYPASSERREAIAYVRAALVAAREPTEAMQIRAGRDHCSDDHYDPEQTWEMMIDAALEPAK